MTDFGAKLISQDRYKKVFRVKKTRRLIKLNTPEKVEGIQIYKETVKV
jgi:hypothetical protein